MNVIGPPTGEGFCEGVATTDEATCTVWISAAEIEGAVVASPLYETVIEWVPAVNVEIIKVGKLAGPIGEPLSMNWKVPVAMGGVTVAVNITNWPRAEGLALDVTTTEDAVFAVRAICGEVDAGRLILPRYCAVRNEVPALKVTPANVAVPLVTLAVPSSVVPLKKFTCPVAVEGVTVAVNMTG